MADRPRVLHLADQVEVAGIPVVLQKRRVGFQQQGVAGPQRDVPDLAVPGISVGVFNARRTRSPQALDCGPLTFILTSRPRVGTGDHQSARATPHDAR